MSIYDKVPKGAITLSISQIKTGKDCLRKNWLEKVAKLPIIFSESTTRGSILHECAERWLEAEHTIDPSSPQWESIFPEDWFIKTEKKQSVPISEEERSWVRRILAKAINDRELIRHPDQMVEWQFLEELIPKEGDKPAVWLVGYSDLCVGNDTIIDHKSCKNFRWTCNEDPRSDKYVGGDIQLNCYGYFLAKHKLETEGTPLPSHVHVRHIQYGYEDERVKHAKASTPWSDVLKTLEDIKDTARIIRDARSEKSFEGVRENLSACGAFGGCKFKDICGGMEDPEDYREKIEETIKLNNEYRQHKLKANTMANKNLLGMLDELEKTAPNTKATTELKLPTKPEVVLTEEPAVTTKAVEPKDANTKAEVLACMAQIETNMKPMGIDLNNVPPYVELQAKLEVILDAEQAEKKAKADAEAKAKADAEAKVKADAGAKAKSDAAYAMKEKATVTEEAKVKADAGAVEVPVVEAIVETTTKVTQTVGGVSETKSVTTVEPLGDVDLEPIKKKAVSLRKGFVLLINASSSSYGNNIDLATVYKEVSDKVIAHDATLNATQVHATVIASAADVAEKMLKGQCVTAVTLNETLRDFASEITPYADVVVYGVQDK